MPGDTGFTIEWDGAEHALCCRGCEAVAHAIVEGGLGDYYRFRTDAPAPASAEPALPAALSELAVYDHPAMQASFVRGPDDRREAALILEGITCAACVWLNEQHLKRLPGVHEVHVNYAARRAQVVWDAARLRLSDILAAVRAVGYDARPYDPAHSQRLLRDERRALLRRLGVAGVLGAQIMTLSVALYVGDWAGTDARLAAFFVWTSALLAVPVLGYAAQPFFRGAWNDLRRARAGMDVPVALGMSTAFGASIWNTVTGHGVVYFDSLAMFAFLLLGARYFEHGARARAAAAVESLVQAGPALTRRFAADGTLERVAVSELRPGDRVLVPAGEAVPADGVVLEGRSSADEGLLTGEGRPVAKTIGAALIGGSVNIASPLTMCIERVGPETVLAGVLRLLDRAQAQKPRLARLADRVASWFVVTVLAVAAAAGAWWWAQEPARALPVVIAVLVVTCPCALGLATPAALTAAIGALTRRGVLVVRGDALETLARATHFVFDKTGTLTLGEPRLARVLPLGDVPARRCLALAAVLEQHSAHPLARAVLHAVDDPVGAARRVTHHAGEGLCADIDGHRYWLGSPEFIARRLGHTLAAAQLAPIGPGATVVVLASRGAPLAALVFRDQLRPGAARLVAALRRRGRHVLMLTGDSAASAQSVARAIGIEEVHARLKPGEKLAHVRALQTRGAVVAMIGDGVNDAPVLAAAQVSVAMSAGAPLAAASADMVLLARALDPLVGATRVARRTRAVIRQNLGWAAGYNVLALPLAVAGFVPPWLAALGMSASSLLVVANALRLLNEPRMKPPMTQINAG